MDPRERGSLLDSIQEEAPQPLSCILLALLAPTVPQDVISTSNSSSHLLVRWKPPTQRNGNLTYYLVLWQRLAEDGDLYLNDYCHRGGQGRRAGRPRGGWGREDGGAGPGQMGESGAGRRPVLLVSSRCGARLAAAHQQQ